MEALLRKSFIAGAQVDQEASLSFFETSVGKRVLKTNLISGPVFQRLALLVG